MLLFVTINVRALFSLGCFYPQLGKIWKNPNVGLKISFNIWTRLQLSLSTVHFLISFLTQHLGLSIFDPNLGWNNPAFFKVYKTSFLISFFLEMKWPRIDRFSQIHQTWESVKQKCAFLHPLRRVLLAQLKQPHPALHKIGGTCVNVTVRTHTKTHIKHTHTQVGFPGFMGTWFSYTNTHTEESHGVHVEWTGNPCQGRPSRSWPNKQMMSSSVPELGVGDPVLSCLTQSHTIPPLWASLLDFSSFAFSFFLSRAGLTL